MEERQLQRCTIKRRRRGNLNLNLGGDGVLFEFLADLPESLLLEIFLRLPLKSVFRSKCVSKSWLSLISDPMFAQSYFRRSQIMDSRRVNTYPQWALLYRYGCHLDLSPDDRWLHVFNRATHPVFGRLPNFTLRFLSEAGAKRDDGKAPVVVLAVSNGLLLSTATPGWHDCYYVCNPLTRQWSALPKPPRIHKWVSLGFIVEPINGTFQVVRIGGYKGSSNTVNFEIFSSKTLQWKDKTVSFDLLVRVFYCPQMVNYRHAVPCKKILHWIEYNDRIIMYDTSQTDTAIDETIRCRLIDLPGDQAIHDKAITGILGVCQDHLRYCHVPEGFQNFSVWELRKYNNERVLDWGFLFRIRFDDINPSLSDVPRAVAFHPFDPDRFYLYRFPDKLASLNLRTRVCRDRIRPKGILNWWTVFAFVLPPWPTPVPQISSTPVGLL